jgi:hypothetical protein
MNDGTDNRFDLVSGTVVDSMISSGDSQAEQDTIYLGAWDGWKFCPPSLLPERGAVERSEAHSGRQKAPDSHPLQFNLPPK